VHRTTTNSILNSNKRSISNTIVLKTTTRELVLVSTYVVVVTSTKQLQHVVLVAEAVAVVVVVAVAAVVLIEGWNKFNKNSSSNICNNTCSSITQQPQPRPVPVVPAVVALSPPTPAVTAT